MNSLSVSAEGAGRSIDGNGDGSDTGKSVGQVVLISYFGIVESGNGCNNFCSVEFAVSLEREENESI